MRPIINLIDKEKIIYFEEVLYPMQDSVLGLIDNENFYLTGGTCLSRFYYNHRYSEDLDFFFDGVSHSISSYEKDYITYITKIRDIFDINITVTSENFKRIFVNENDISLKVEFIFEPYPRVGKMIDKHNFKIDSKENIAVNKLTAAYTRKTAKDFFDLYFLLKEFDIHELLRKTEVKLKTPAYEELILSLKNSFFEGEVNSPKAINEKDFLEFVDFLIDNLLNYAKQ